jgi:hypothetical protein
VTTTISLNDTAVQTRYAELNKLRKVELIARAKNPVPGHIVIDTAHDMAGWRKDELIMSIIQSERDYAAATTVVSRPNRPARVVLTPAAKAALRTGRALMGTDVAAELANLNMIDADGRLTENGTRMADYLGWQFILGQLAKQVRAENITGEDLADVAAGIDAGEETGSIPGTSIDFQLAFALAASLSDQSAEDLRQDLETYLGWND